MEEMIPKRHRVVASPNRAVELLKQGRIAGAYKSYLSKITRCIPCRVIAVYGDVVILKH